MAVRKKSKPARVVPPTTATQLRGVQETVAKLDKEQGGLIGRIDVTLNEMLGNHKFHRHMLAQQKIEAWERGYDIGFRAGQAAGSNLAGAKETARLREAHEQDRQLATTSSVNERAMTIDEERRL